MSEEKIVCRNCKNPDVSVGNGVVWCSVCLTQSTLPAVPKPAAKPAKDKE